ncbi:MAG: hypothetical protein JNL82_02655 [Myxococcales bacterium]|nr:hypothetical protein [Myxococcales bacterium]
MRVRPLLRALTALAACSPADPPSEPTPATRPAPAVDCDALPRAACIASPACTLVHVPRDEVTTRSYICRPAAGACELGLDQSDAAACGARPGCKFVPASCYCACKDYGHARVPDPPDVNACRCECALGPPPICQEADRPPMPASPGMYRGSCGGSRGEHCMPGLVCAYPGGPRTALGVCSELGERSTPCGRDFPPCDAGLECRDVAGDLQCEPPAAPGASTP